METNLLEAPRHGPHQEVQQLLAEGVGPDDAGSGGGSSLFDAVKGGHIDVL
jgi:hypothetical protein